LRRHDAREYERSEARKAAAEKAAGSGDLAAMEAVAPGFLQMSPQTRLEVFEREKHAQQQAKKRA
jgi:hypothetical protein